MIKLLGVLTQFDSVAMVLAVWWCALADWRETRRRHRGYTISLAARHTWCFSTGSFAADVLDCIYDDEAARPGGDW